MSKRIYETEASGGITPIMQEKLPLQVLKEFQSVR